MKKHLLAKVFRYDPELPEDPFFEEYKIPVAGLMKVLDVLKYIKENLDETLAFRWSCGLEKCGSCAVRVNGKPVLACKEIVKGERITIEPLENHPVIKDLVVDLRGYALPMASLRPSLARLTPPPRHSVERLKPETFGKFISLSSCVDCHACDSVCPVLKEFPSDYAGPWTMLCLARLASDPRDTLDRTRIAFDEGIYHCVGCLACSSVCPKGLDVGRIIQDLKSSLVTSGTGPLRSQRRFREAIQKTGSLLAPEKGRLREEMKADAGEVGVFLGCAMDIQNQGEGRSMIALLKKSGAQLIVPQGQICCGGPLLWTGQTEAFEEVVIENVKAFEETGVKIIVTGCPGCGMTLKKDYPEILLKKEGRVPGFKIVDVREYLEESNVIGGPMAQDSGIVVTYHDPCHLNRGQGLKDIGRGLLRKVGVQLIEMEHSDRCCGGFATLSYPEIADRLADEKVRLAEKTSASLLVTDCPTCLQHIGKALERKGSKMKVISTLEFILNRKAKG